MNSHVTAPHGESFYVRGDYAFPGQALFQSDSLRHSHCPFIRSEVKGGFSSNIIESFRATVVEKSKHSLPYATISHSTRTGSHGVTRRVKIPSGVSKRFKCWAQLLSWCMCL